MKYRKSKIIRLELEIAALKQELQEIKAKLETKRKPKAKVEE